MVNELIVGEYYLFKLRISEIMTLNLGTQPIVNIGIGGEPKAIIGYVQSSGSFGVIQQYEYATQYRASITYNTSTSSGAFDIVSTTSTILLSQNITLDYILLYGKFYGYSGQPEFIQYLKDHAEPYSLLLNLGLMDGEKNYVRKDYDGEVIYRETIGGNLREESDLMNPSILIEYPDLPSCNYVRIFNLHRTYFVKNIILVRKNIYRLELHVDVLNSYDLLILNQDAYITRNETSYDTLLADERLPLEDVPTIDMFDVSSFDTPVATNVKNLSAFNFDYGDLTRPHYVLNNFGPLLHYVNNAYPPTPPSTFATEDVESPLTQMEDVGPLELSSRGSYLINYDKLIAVVYATKGNDTVAGGIESIVAYPFNVESFVKYKTTTTIVAFGGEHAYYLNSSGGYKWTQGIAPSPAPFTAPICKQNTFDYLVIADFTFPSSRAGDPDTFVEYEPKTTYELYIPFVSWISISACDLLDNRIIIYYSIDIATGEGTAYVRDVTHNRTIYSAPVVLGVKVPITTTNAYEIAQQQKNATNNLIMTLFTGVSAIVGGMVSENPLMAVGGASASIMGIKNYVNAQNLQIGRTQGVAGGPQSALMDNHRVWLRQITHSNVTIDSDIYAHVNGYPLKTYDTIGNYSGYTEVGDIHFAPQLNSYITSDEIDEIVSLLKQGVIL